MRGGFCTLVCQGCVHTYVDIQFDEKVDFRFAADLHVEHVHARKTLLAIELNRCFLGVGRYCCACSSLYMTNGYFQARGSTRLPWALLFSRSVLYGMSHHTCHFLVRDVRQYYTFPLATLNMPVDDKVIWRLTGAQHTPHLKQTGVVGAQYIGGD